jgi:hypothetical protein
VQCALLAFIVADLTGSARHVQDVHDSEERTLITSTSLGSLQQKNGFTSGNGSRLSAVAQLDRFVE